MALSRKLLVEGEHEVMTTRTHVKALFLPGLLLVVTCAVAGFVLAVAQNTEHSGVLSAVILLVAVLVLVWWALRPFLRWFARTYTVTNRRLVEQTGILTRSGRVIPWSRVNDVGFEKNLSDRILRCGTLVIHDASEQAGLRLEDVPHVEDVHRTVTDLIFETHTGHHDPGGVGDGQV